MLVGFQICEDVRDMRHWDQRAEKGRVCYDIGEFSQYNCVCVSVESTVDVMLTWHVSVYSQRWRRCLATLNHLSC